ncbi:hypothetical protein M9Y10_001365 [Tritrichomonas musculus]|uniref:CUE domain-containing protein n=1 Tax=Tritrichomonas musculus TaxID=1915356 RepID=A0ABR2L6T2_9EUKA
MSDQRAVNQETVDTLSVMFPHIFQDEFSTNIRDYSFDEVVELMQIYYQKMMIQVIKTIIQMIKMTTVIAILIIILILNQFLQM